MVLPRQASRPRVQASPQLRQPTHQPLLRMELRPHRRATRRLHRITHPRALATIRRLRQATHPRRLNSVRLRLGLARPPPQATARPRLNTVRRVLSMVVVEPNTHPLRHHTLLRRQITHPRVRRRLPLHRTRRLVLSTAPVLAALPTVGSRLLLVLSTHPTRQLSAQRAPNKTMTTTIRDLSCTNIGNSVLLSHIRQQMLQDGAIRLVLYIC